MVATWTIDPDVARISKRWNLPAEWVAAVIRQEGGREAIVRAVQCSIPSVKTFDDAVDIVCRSAVGALVRLVQGRELVGEWVSVFGAKWAPVGVANDPTNLNAHWVPGIQRILGVDKLRMAKSRLDTGSDVPGGGAA